MKKIGNRIATVILVITIVIGLAPIMDTQTVYAASKPGKAVISAVKANSETAFTVKWKNVNGAKGYQVRYSLKSSMANSTSKTTTAKSRKITNLKAGKKYYVQVRAYNKKGSKKIYGKWSKKKNVTTNYSIKYVLNGGTQASGQKTSYTKATATFSLKSPTRSGYDFKGWYTSSAFDTKVTSVKKGTTGNKTFYAKWAKKVIEEENVICQNVVAYDSDNYKITLDRIVVKGNENPKIIFTCENKTTETYKYSFDYLVLNEYMVPANGIYMTTIFGGKKAIIKGEIPREDMNKIGISDINTISGGIHIYDYQGYGYDYFVFDKTITTTAPTSTMASNAITKHQLVYAGKGIKVYYLGLVTGEAGEKEPQFAVYNELSIPLYISEEGVAYGETMSDADFSAVVYPNSYAISNFENSESEAEGNNMMEFRLNLYERKGTASYQYDYTDIIVVNLK